MARQPTRRNPARKHAKRIAYDEQTGKKYILIDEKTPDTVAATLSVIYMLLVMLFFFWLLFDIWTERYTLANLIAYRDTRRLASPIFRLAAYALIGGALGATVNGIRSFVVWHVERRAFGRHFIWKYVTLPWVGATLAFFTYALIRSGVAIFSGDGVQSSATTGQMLTIFGSGALAGYGSHEVLHWLDFQVTRLFRIQAAGANLTAPQSARSSRKKVENILQSKRSRGGNRKNGRAPLQPARKAVRQPAVPNSTAIKRNGGNAKVIPLQRSTSGNGRRRRESL